MSTKSLAVLFCLIFSWLGLPLGALADVAAWQSVVNGGTPAVTRFTAVSGGSPVSINVGTFGVGAARSFEFVFNAAGAGPSKTLMGSQDAASGGQYLKLHQWNNTGKFGLTTQGVADDVFANSPTLSNQQVHAVFTSNGSVTTLYLNGVAQTGTVPQGLKLTGTNGLGAFDNATHNAFSDNLDGSITGFASYARALSASEVAARYVALTLPALPTPNLALWQSVVNADTPAATRFSSVAGASPVSQNVGSLGTGTAARSFEFVFNATGAGPSKTLLGSDDTASGRQYLKLNQWNNTQRFGLTTPGVADDVFANSPVISGQNIHAVFVSSGSVTSLYLNGVLQTGTINRALTITGLNGLAAFDNAAHSTFSDNLDGTISGFASYARALNQTEVTARFNALATTATVPGAPVIGTATPLQGGASVAFTAPASDGGSPITGYTATASPGGLTATGTNSPITFSGLTTGTSYTFTVKATNAVGTGPASAASNVVLVSSNLTPTDLTLLGSVIAEGNAANATVGTLSATDPDAGDTHTFTLVAGTGSTDNGSFTIAGNALRITPVTNASTKSSYAVRVRATDAGGLFFEKAFTVRVVATGLNVAKFGTSQLHIQPGFNYKQIVTGNFDADGIADIATITTNDQCIVLLSSQGYLTANTYNTSRASTAVAVADVNADGILDLLIGWGNSSPLTAGVMACLGSGSGFSGGNVELVALPNPSLVLFPVFLSVADVNADKKPDIIVQTSLESDFRTYLKNGTQWGYDFVQSSDAGFTPVMRGAVAGDFNLDGILDVAHATSLGGGSSKVSVLTMNSSGSFNRNDLFTVSAEIQAISVADLNGDGKPDLAVAASNGSGGQLILARNTTPGAEVNNVPTFAAPATVTTGTAGLLGIGCADMNRDGRPDVITSENQQLRVFYGNGDMTVTASVNNPVSVPTGSPVSMSFAAGDFSNDGMPDLFAGNGQLLTNLRGALFATKPLNLLAGLSRPGVPLRVGSSPLLAGFSAASTAPWLTVTPASGFLGLSPLVASGDPAALTFGKHRGKVNLTSSILQGAEVDVTLDVAAATGTLGTSQIVPIPAENNWRSPVAVGDFNNDGRMDFVNARLNNPGDFAFGFRVLLTGSGGALTAVNSSNVANPQVTLQQLIPGDYNGDGHLDVAGLESWSSGGFRLHVAHGNGAGSFGSTNLTGVLTATGLSYVPVLPKGDFNGDGRDDLVMFHGGEATMLLGTTSGVFRTHGRPCFVRSVNSSGGRIDYVAAGDFNGDGSLDLVADSYLLLGDGQGGLRLAGASISSANHQLFKVQAGDFNADNITDALYWRVSELRVSYGSSTLNVVNAGASLSYLTDPAMIYNANAAGYSIRAASAADVNGDGILDLVSTANDSNTCITLLGNGDGTFQAAKVITRTLYSGTYPLHVGDVSGDGAPDVFQIKGDGSNNWEFNRLPGQTAASSTTLAVTGGGTGVYGQVAPVSVTVAATTPAAALGIPLGSVSLKKGAVVVATTTRTTSGAWTFTPVGLGVGTHSLTAQYDGDARFQASISGSVNVTITQATGALNLASSLNPSLVGDSVTFTATLSPVTAGSVTFKNGASTLGTATLDSTGVATFTTSALAAGAHSITAVFAGNADVSAVTSAVLTQTVDKLPATVVLNNLLASYDGTAKSAGANTLPAGLPVSFTYNGSSTAPTAVGSYAVVATVNSPTYQGSASGTFVIQKGTAVITITNVNHFFDGNAKSVGVTTVPAELPHSVTYNGSATAPSALGSYAVVVTINSPNYEGSATDTMVISAAALTTTTLTSSVNPSVFLTPPTFTATVSSASVTPTGEMQLLIDNVLYEAKQVNASGVATFTPPATALAGGSRSIRANYNANGANAAYAPSNGTLTQVVNKSPLSVTLDAPTLNQTYNGSARVVTASVTPPSTHASVQVDITYDGSSLAPVNAGTYAVVATINDPSLQGSASGTLTVAKAPVTVTSNQLVFAYDGQQRVPVVQLSPAVPFTLTYDAMTGGTPAGNPTASAPINAGNYRVLIAAGNNHELTPPHLPLTITKRGVSITLGSLSAITDGSTPHAVTAVTDPPGMSLNITYQFHTLTGSPTTTPPSAAGLWNVAATLTSPNHEGSAQAQLRLRTRQNTRVVVTGPASEQYGRSVSYRASIIHPDDVPYPEGTPTPAGIVTFKEGGTAIGTAQLNVNGVATLVTGFARRDTPYAITAEYAGNADFFPTTTSNTVQTTITKIPLTPIADSPLVVTYDGQPKEVKFTTSFGRTRNVPMTITYGGSSTKPVNASAALIPVVATINDPLYQGSATVQLRIDRAPATITAGNTRAAFDGTPKLATYTTNPPNLAASVTYNGSSTAPSAVGTYPVIVQLNEANYTAPDGTGSLIIGPSTSKITISDTTQVYDGNAKPVKVTVDPAAPYTVTYNGSANAPSAAGEYEVIVQITGGTRVGQASAKLVIQGLVTAGTAVPSLGTASGLLAATTVVIDGSTTLTATPAVAAPGQHTIRAIGSHEGLPPPQAGDTAWFFEKWFDDFSTENPRTITIGTGMNGKQKFTPMMKPRMWIVPVVNPPGAGTITGEDYYDHGELATFRVTPAAGYVIAGWKNGTTTLTGEFLPVLRRMVRTTTGEIATSPIRWPVVELVKGATVTLKSSNEAHGTLQGIVSNRLSLDPAPWQIGTVTVPEGQTFNVKALATSGYVFSHWSVTGANVVGAFDLDPSGVMRITGTQREFNPATTDITAVANFVKSEPLLDTSIIDQGDDSIGLGPVSIGTVRSIGVRVNNLGTQSASQVQLTGLRVTAIRMKPSSNFGGSNVTAGGFCPFYYEPLTAGEQANPNPTGLNPTLVNPLRPSPQGNPAHTFGTIFVQGTASDTTLFNWPQVGLNLELFGIGTTIKAVQYRVTAWLRSNETGDLTPVSIWVQ